MKRNPVTLVLSLVTIPLASPGCGGEAANGGAGQDDGGSEAADLAMVSDAWLTPDAAVCDQLAAAARTRFQSFLDSTSLLACQVDSDCEIAYLQSLSCFAACEVLMGTAAISAVTAVGAGFCDEYFAAGCLALTPPCPRSPGVCACEEPSCSRRPLPAGTCGCHHGQCGWGPPQPIDAAVDGGNGDASIEGADGAGQVMEIRSS